MGYSKFFNIGSSDYKVVWSGERFKSRLSVIMLKYACIGIWGFKPSNSINLHPFRAPKKDEENHISEFLNGKSLKKIFIWIYIQDSTFKVVMPISFMINIYMTLFGNTLPNSVNPI